MNPHFPAALKSRLANILPLPENSRWILVWPAAAVLLAIAGWLLLLVFLEGKRQEMDNGARLAAEGLARHHARQLERTVDSIDQTLQHVKFEWELARGELRLERMLQRGLFPSASDVVVTIAGRDGRVLTTTRAHAAKDTVSGQPYFLAHRDTRLDFLHIGRAPGDRSTAAAGIDLSRRLNTDAGDFAGVVNVSAIPDIFTASYDETILGANGLLGMTVVGGNVTTARIGALGRTPARPVLPEIPHFAEKSGSTVLDGARWFGDRRSRYIGWQTLDAHPIIAIVGLDRQDMLAPYLAYRASLLRYAWLATIVLCMAATAGAVFSMRLAERRRQLELTQAAYRMATEEGIEGFYIFRPVLGTDGAIADFAAIDCNSRGAELFNLSREDVLGRNVSTLPQGAQSTYLIRNLRAAMAAGAHEDEQEFPAGGALPARWLRLKVVRSNENLAVRLTDISDSKAHVAELERRGNEDALTGLPNRHWANLYLPQAIERAAAQQSMLAILFIDLDGFKAVNDSLGHEAGDELLRNAGRRLKLAVRPGDHVVRIGGDEFVVLLEDILHKSDAAQVAERVLNAFQTAFRLPQGMQSISASIGISTFPGDGSDADTLLRNADVAMYSVKSGGKRNYRFYDARFYEALRARMERESELRAAIELDQFVVHYQPRVDILTGATSSMEALVRWVHPSKGLINPQEFIPMAEETGIILKLGELVIDKVCAQLAAWIRAGWDPVPVSINVSPRQFNEVDIAEVLLKALTHHAISPRLIEIELTESSMMGEHVEISSSLNAIQNLGVKILVDDFGTGYSSLSQLQRLDFDVLKVDQAFTSRLEKTEEGSVFFKAIITMAHALGMRVVAEGVETIGQVRILQALQCDEIQGFYISRPLPPAEIQPAVPGCFLLVTA
jgi:diguanylate cyclase (GGDEF)-like protein